MLHGPVVNHNMGIETGRWRHCKNFRPKGVRHGTGTYVVKGEEIGSGGVVNAIYRDTFDNVSTHFGASKIGFKIK